MTEEPSRQRLDFGPTQVRSIDELKPGKKYIHHWFSEGVSKDPDRSGNTD